MTGCSEHAGSETLLGAGRARGSLLGGGKISSVEHCCLRRLRCLNTSFAANPVKNSSLSFSTWRSWTQARSSVRSAAALKSSGKWLCSPPRLRRRANGGAAIAATGGANGARGGFTAFRIRATVAENERPPRRDAEENWINPSPRLSDALRLLPKFSIAPLRSAGLRNLHEDTLQRDSVRKQRGFVARAVEFPIAGSHASTQRSAVKNLKDALRAWLAAATKDGSLDAMLEASGYEGRVPVSRDTILEVSIYDSPCISLPLPRIR